jgi:hypothetical protein
MVKATDYRVSLDPKVHLALEVLAAQKHASMKDLASAIIWQGVGPSTRAIAEQADPRRLNLPEVVVSQGDVEVNPSGDLDRCGASSNSDSKESKAK